MNGTIQYTIRPYDTIWMLAQVFNTTVDSIMDLNPGIDPRNLMIGQVITIRPGSQNYPSYPNITPGSEFSGRNIGNVPSRGTTEQRMPGGAAGRGTTGPTMPGGTAGGTTGPMMPRGTAGQTAPGSTGRGTAGPMVPGGTAGGTTSPMMPGGTTGGTTSPMMPGGAAGGTTSPMMPGGTAGGTAGPMMPGGTAGGTAGPMMPGGAAGGSTSPTMPRGTTGQTAPGSTGRGTTGPMMPGGTTGGTTSPTMPRGTTGQTAPGSAGRGTSGSTMPGGTTSPTMPGGAAGGTTGPTMPDRGTNSQTMPRRGTTDQNMPSRGTTNQTMPGRGMMDHEDMMNREGMMDREMMDHDMQDMCGNMMDLMNQFRQLWVEHSIWTAFTIFTMVNSLPEADVYTQRLLRNPEDFAAALAPFYGDAAAQKFGQLLSDHLTIAAEIVNAALAGDNNAMTDADRRWHENADEITGLLASLNPFWNKEDWSAMMNEHLDNVSGYAENLLNQDYEGGVKAFDQMLNQVLEMGDMMAEGIAMQFPG